MVSGTLVQTFITMLDDVEPQSSGRATPATLGDRPATLSNSPAHKTKTQNSEALSDLLENKLAISDPSDAQHPSSGSDRYSDEIVRPQLFHSRPHSLPRSASEVHPRESSQPHLFPSLTVLADTKNKPSPGNISSQRAPRPDGSPGYSSAPTTPSADSSRTHSYVFTSSRQAGILGGERLIGVVNQSISESTLQIRPSHPPKLSRRPTLSPEAINAHALGAIHATSAESPFQTFACDRADLSAVVSPIEIPIQPPLFLTPPGVEVDNTRTGIDFYVNAARIGRSPTAESALASIGSAPSEETRPASHRRSSSDTTSLQSPREHSGAASFKEVSTSISQNEQTVTKRPTRRRTKGYSKYIESETSEYSFTTNAPPRSRNSSHDSSASSNSKPSFDESITGLSCFGLIGSGTPVSVFGTAVMSASRKPSVAAAVAIHA